MTEKSNEGSLERCRELIGEHLDRLVEVANDAIEVGFEPHEFGVFCFDTTEEPWVGMIRELRSKHRTELQGDGESEPVAIGALPLNELEQLVRPLSDTVADMLADTSENGMIRFLLVRGQDIAVTMEHPTYDAPDDVAPEDMN